MNQAFMKRFGNDPRVENVKDFEEAIEKVSASGIEPCGFPDGTCPGAEEVSMTSAVRIPPGILGRRMAWINCGNLGQDDIRVEIMALRGFPGLRAHPYHDARDNAFKSLETYGYTPEQKEKFIQAYQEELYYLCRQGGRRLQGILLREVLNSLVEGGPRG